MVLERLQVTPLALDDHIETLRDLGAGYYSRITHVIKLYESKQWIPVYDLSRVLSELDFYVSGASDLQEQSQLDAIRRDLVKLIESQVDTFLPIDLSPLTTPGSSLVLSATATHIKAEHQLKNQDCSVFTTLEGNGIGSTYVKHDNAAFVIEYNYVVTKITLMTLPTNEVVWHRESPRVYSGCTQKLNSLSRTT